jgi:hypothetical protein
MPAGVVADRRALVLGNLRQAREHVLDRPVGPVRSFEGRVGLVHVGLVVLVVVEAHRLLVDVRLERRVVVGQVRNLVRHRSLLSVVVATLPRFAERLCGNPRDVRVLFTAYLAVTAMGLAVYIAIGLLHR